MILELFCICLMALMLRVLFVLGKGTDQDFHFLNVRWAKRHGLKLPQLECSVVTGWCAYPSLPAFIISRFPKSVWNFAGRFMNIAYDLIAVMVVYFIAQYFFARWGAGVGEEKTLVSLSAAGWAALIFATTPILFPITARLKAIGGRTIGPMLSLIYFAIVGYSLIEHSYAVMILCVPVGILIVLSSTFSTQALVIYSVLLSCFLVSPLPLLLLLVVFVVGCAMPWLDFRRLVFSRRHHYSWYWNSLGRNSPIDNRNRLRNLLKMPTDLIRNPVLFAQNLFENNSFFIALYSMPALLGLAYMAVDGAVLQDATGVSVAGRFGLAMMICGLIAFVITSFRPFIIFGQAERYLEYSAPYIVTAFVFYAFSRNSPESLLLIMYFNILLILVNFVVMMGPEYLSQLKTSPPDSIKSVVDVLNGLPEPRILTIPTKLAYLVSSHTTNPDSKYCYDWICQGKDGYKYMLNDHAFYQYPREDFATYFANYQIDTLVVQKRALLKSNALGLNYDLNRYRLLFENSEYLIYRIAD